MASFSRDNLIGRRSKSGNSSSGSSECSSEEVKRLFQACDRDGDGYIDSQDLLEMCRQLNMEDAVDEIMAQLGVAQHGRISFHDFVRCRMQLIAEIEQEKLREHRLELSGVRLQHDHTELAIHGDSDNSMGLPPSSQDYDSGARDMSPEPPSLYKLLETHEPALYDQCRGDEVLTNLLDVCNTLHLAALTSLKGEIIELNTRLQHTLAEKEHIEKQIHKYQTDKHRQQRESEDRLEQQTVRYEDRITELHSVIAELQKKFDRHHINVIREEDEDQYDDSDGLQSNRSAEDISLNENNANESQSASIAEIGNEINAELSRVVSELECAINENRRQSEEDEVLVDRLTLDDCQTQDKAVQVSPDISLMSMDGSAIDMTQIPNRAKFLENELILLQGQNHELQEQIGRQETELNKLRAQNGGIREERDRMKRKVRELQTRMQSIEASSPRHSATSTPTKHYPAGQAPHDSGSSQNLSDQPVSRMAELKKIKTWTTTERPVLGTDITTMGLPITSKVAEHLVQNLKESSDVQEIRQSAHKCGTEVSDTKVKEFEIEVERLQSKIDHLKSQHDLNMLSLAESKAHCDRMTVLMGKYESNNTALQMVLTLCDQALEAYHVLVSLLDSENSILITNCKASGLGNYGLHSDSEYSQEDIAAMVQNAQRSRRSAENFAKQMMVRHERTGHSHRMGSSPNPWEELSSNSRTTSTTSSTASSIDSEWSKAEEQKLRELIHQLQSDRTAVKTTVLELESVHIDPTLQESTGPSCESQRLDLENAVIMQELMAIKEERAELKSINYLLDKEKVAMELQLFSLQCKEEAYLQRIKNLQAELAERTTGQEETLSPSVSLEKIKSLDNTQLTQELHQAQRREKALKSRIKELLSTLEYMSHNSEYRHQQSAAFVNDLKKANSALIEAFEKAKKKYQAKLKKQDGQVQALRGKYEQQVGSLMCTIQQMKAESSRPPASETSL